MKSATTYLRKIFSSIKDTAKYDKHIKPNHSQTTTEMLDKRIKKPANTIRKYFYPISHWNKMMDTSKREASFAYTFSDHPKMCKYGIELLP